MESVGFSNIVPYETGGIEISDIDAKPIKVPVYAPVNNFNPVSNRLELAIISLMKLIHFIKGLILSFTIVNNSF